jgi:hypothetical protein
MEEPDPEKEPTPVRRKRGRPPTSEGRKQMLIALRGRPEWRAWLKKFAAHLGTDMSGAIDQALDHLAYKERFERPPQR